MRTARAEARRVVHKVTAEWPTIQPERKSHESFDRNLRIVLLSSISMAENVSLIEQFVATLNARGLESRFDRDVPRELREKEVNGGMFEWKIRRSDDPNAWVAELEGKLLFRFPPLYRELITRYRFAEFEVGPIMFLANTGTPDYYELADVIFRDKHLYPTLLEKGLIQFGKQAGGGYDPICFDLTRAVGTDAPIVQLDHEGVLIYERIRVLDEIAPTFKCFVEQVIDGRYSAG